MKIIIVFIVLITIALAQSKEGFDEIKSWRERI